MRHRCRTTRTASRRDFVKYCAANSHAGTGNRQGVAVQSVRPIITRCPAVFPEDVIGEATETDDHPGVLDPVVGADQLEAHHPISGCCVQPTSSRIQLGSEQQ
jgi:hypothetical protein